MSIEILKPGLLSLLVDEGRYGFRSSGVGPGGAMDRFAHHVANYLVGNRERAATMEIRFPGPELFFQNDATVCITGFGVDAVVDNTKIESWKSALIKKGSILSFQRAATGSTAYISVGGGWQADSWLGSFSTQAGIAAGGYRGRALKKNDIVEFGVKANEPEGTGVPDNILEDVYQPSDEIRCVATAETDQLSHASLEKFKTTAFTPSLKSNRMGFRLEGELLELRNPLELVSSPVDFGAVQLLPDGKLIILMADHQTTGGYPRIASVIEADLPRLSQRNPGDMINFRMISFAEAEAALLSRRQQLETIRRS